MTADPENFRGGPASAREGSEVKTIDPMIEQMLSWQRELDRLPPAPYAIIARHDVPYYGVYRMWDTRGRFVVYVNRGMIHDLPWRTGDRAAWGIPVIVQ